MPNGRRLFALRQWSAWLLLTVVALCSACSDPEGTRIVEPAYEDPCRFFGDDKCSGNGECHGNALGEPTCLCVPGYQGDGCELCEDGFHIDAQGRCVTDRGCAGQAEDPCGSDGKCVQQSGVLACACKPGYGGPRCTLCADGYARSDGLCRPDKRGPVLRDGGTANVSNASDGKSMDAGAKTNDAGPSSEGGSTLSSPVCTSQQTTTLSFDGLSGWPDLDNLCNADKDLVLPELTMQSRVGSSSAYVWLCAKNTKASLGLATRHVELEVAAAELAQITFPHAVSSLSFDYGAPESALSLEVLVNDVSVKTIEAAQYEKGTLSLQLGQPTARITLRSRTLYRQNVAIDNLNYTYAQCQ
jgi:Laminin EGF domain